MGGTRLEGTGVEELDQQGDGAEAAVRLWVLVGEGGTIQTCRVVRHGTFGGAPAFKAVLKSAWNGLPE